MANFTFNENDFFGNTDLNFEEMKGSDICEDLDCKPKLSSINSILAYSKALSVRDSSYLDKIKFIIN